MTSRRQLDRWVAAALISTEQARRIAAFEHERGRPFLPWAVAGLAAFTIAIGIVSIVAANWDAIPGRLKIGVDLLLLAGLGAGVVALDRRGSGWVVDTAIVVLYGAVLASIALVGQVYQLGGEAHMALLAWSALTAVLMSRTRSGLPALLWIAGLQATYGAWLYWLAEQHDLSIVALSGIPVASLLCIALGGVAALRARRPALATMLTGVGWAELVLIAALATTVFYADLRDEDWTRLWPGLVLSLLIAVPVWKGLAAARAANAARSLLAACLLFAYLPWAIAREQELVAALAFVGLWVLVAYVAHGLGSYRLLNLATAVIGVRILIIYFEVFGSLLGTGLGLVSGGALALLLVVSWMRKSREFARVLDEKGRE